MSVIERELLREIWLQWPTTLPEDLLVRVETALLHRTEAATEPPPLDVDRLAKVLERLEVHFDPTANSLHSTCDHDDQAGRFAREYAATADAEGD